MIEEIFSDTIAYHLILAAFIGSLFGLEREIAKKDPSLRTFMLICLGSCTFALVSLQSAEGHSHADPGRIAAQIVSGIGFLGAGAIFRSRDRIVGITTAALMWTTAAIGVAIGFDRIDIAIKAAIIALSFMVVLSYLHEFISYLKGSKNNEVTK